MSQKAKIPSQSPSAEILAASLELAQLMNQDRSGIEEDLATEGEKFIGIFCDENYTTLRFPDLHRERVAIIKKGIEDIAIGVMILRTSTLGLVSLNNEIQPYISPHGNMPKGNVIFSMNWKNLAKIRKWKPGDPEPVTQQEMNAAIYRLTVELSKSL